MQAGNGMGVTLSAPMKGTDHILLGSPSKTPGRTDKLPVQVPCCIDLITTQTIHINCAFRCI